MEPAVEIIERASLRARLLHWWMFWFVRPFLRLPFNPLTIPTAGLVDHLGILLPPPLGTHVRAVRGDGFRGEWVRARGVAADRVVLYFHGGGFFCCGLRTHRRLVARISAASGAAVLSVAYRQLPRAPLSGSVADCVAAYRWLLGRGYAPENVVVAGDSAGGFLSFAAPLAALAEGLPAPAGIAALSPLTDLAHEGRNAHPNIDLDAYIPARSLPALTTLLVEGVLPADPLLSPVNGALAGLPPVLIQCGSKEVLRYDAELMAARLAAADVPVRLQVWAHQVHVFQAFGDLAPEGRRAIEVIGAFVRDVTGESTRSIAA